MSKYIGIKPYTYWRYPFKTIYEWVVETPRAIRDFCQRGWRGYANRDTWSLDHYLAEFMPAAVHRLVENEIGWSAAMYDFLEGDEEQYILWKNILFDIQEGFAAAHALREHPWLDDAPTPGNLFDEDEPFRLWLHKNRERIDAIEAELYEKQKHGLALFAEFFDSLWD